MSVFLSSLSTMRVLILRSTKRQINFAKIDPHAVFDQAKLKNKQKQLQPLKTKLGLP